MIMTAETLCAAVINHLLRAALVHVGTVVLVYSYEYSYLVPAYEYMYVTALSELVCYVL